MLGSLAPIPPCDAHTLWSPVSGHSPLPIESTNTPQQQRTRRDATPPCNPILTALDEEEEALAARKANVRRFGATWLRPPGVAKTYQAMVEEAAERAEQEAIARREAAQMEQQAAAEEEARRVRATHGMDMDGEDEVEGMERDLDGDVPDADGFDDSDSGTDIYEPTPGVINSELISPEFEQDVNDDMPDDGSYEHTDTEMEDSTTSDEEGEPPAPRTGENATPEASGNASSARSRHGNTSSRTARNSQLDPYSHMVLNSPINARPSPEVARLAALFASRHNARRRPVGRSASDQLDENRPSGRQ